MIAQAKARFGEPEGLRFTVRGFEEPWTPQEPLDAVVCVGNSLALAPDLIAVRRAIHQMLSAVRPGGVVVVHALNLWQRTDGPCVWQKCRRAALPQGDVLILKGIHRAGPRGFVDLILTGIPSGPILHSESVAWLGLEAAELGQMALHSGATRLEFFGGYQQQPYDRASSQDLLMLAEK